MATGRLRGAYGRIRSRTAVIWSRVESMQLTEGGPVVTLRKLVTNGWMPGAVIGAALVGLLWQSAVHRAPQPDGGSVAAAHASPPAPAVTGIVLRTLGGEVVGRTPPDTYLRLSAPVSLSLESSSQPDNVEFFEFSGGPVPGNEYGPQPRRIGVAVGSTPLKWTVRPGTKVQLYGVAWYGNFGVRSASLWVGYPMPDQTQCPDVAFPPLRPIPHAQVSLVIDAEMNLIQIVTPYENLNFSLKVDPKTCRDDQVRRWLEQSRALR